MDPITTFALAAPALLFAMVAHEYAHGYAAYRYGDLTAYQLGRLTWNPAKHIDPFMTVILPSMMFFFTGMIFGGAKPVPVNPRNYRKYKEGDIVVSLAGVTTNLLIAIACVPLIMLVGMLGAAAPGAIKPIAILQLMLVLSVSVNLTLMMFNLLPIPPLDGSHVMKYLLPPAWSLAYQRVGGFGLLIIMALLYLVPGALRMWLIPARFIELQAERLYFPFMLPNPFSS